MTIPIDNLSALQLPNLVCARKAFSISDNNRSLCKDVKNIHTHINQWTTDSGSIRPIFTKTKDMLFKH